MALERRPLPLGPVRAGPGGSRRTGPATGGAHHPRTHRTVHRAGGVAAARPRAPKGRRRWIAWLPARGS